METIFIYYYVFLAAILLIGIGYYIIPPMFSGPNEEHYIAVNLTKQNDTCKVTWLGGWDFDSFYTNVTVNGVNHGHPKPMTVIFNETCKNIVVKMHDKAVHTDIELYRYNHTGGT